MADSAGASADTAGTAATAAVDDSAAAAKTSATKDRQCPYCGQAFTSSSLGRHLDLYIKAKNPKPPDGVHDVDAIRKMREGITRRQARGSHARRDVSYPGTPGTPGTPSYSKTSPGADSVLRPPAIPKEGQFVVDRQSLPYPFQPTWEATGVINDIPVTTSDHGNGGSSSWASWRARASPARDTPARSQRAPSRVAQKTQLDTKQRMAEAVDTARAAELALRELLSSIRAAKQHVDMNSLPFDFDPLSLDFPALTLQCLQPPPTLFSSTPHPTSTSWSIQPPSKKQYDALHMYFRDEFQKWRVHCATAVTATAMDLTYPPSETSFPRDLRESVKKAEKAAALLERQVQEHLQSTYHVWEQLSLPRRAELWGLELARSVGRRQKQLDKFKETEFTIKQENANLKTQIEHLNSLQQPREYRIVPPATLPIEETFMNYLLGIGASGVHGVAVTLEERHVDLNTMVSRAIDRWKSVIVSTRSAGMGSQKSLDQVTPTATPTSATSTLPPPPPPPQRGTGPEAHLSQGPRAVPSAPAAAATGAQDEDDEDENEEEDSEKDDGEDMEGEDDEEEDEEEGNSDADADAEMDEGDGFAPDAPSTAKRQSQIQPQIEVPKMRGHRGLTLRRSMPGNAAAAQMNSRRRQPQGHTNSVGHTTADANQGVVADDPMFSK
ncbi:hypothetical protein F4808DRAFT_474993 [Astrocystis sublimbata]|nr:hypothetical protein F4808DRAFT_474993 [Astrocystis sublimbata]